MLLGGTSRKEFSLSPGTLFCAVSIHRGRLFSVWGIKESLLPTPSQDINQFLLDFLLDLVLLLRERISKGQTVSSQVPQKLNEVKPSGSGSRL